MYRNLLKRYVNSLCMRTLYAAMFEGSDEVGREQPDDGSSSEEEPGLGFFQPAESDDSETEVR